MLEKGERKEKVNIVIKFAIVKLSEEKKDRGISAVRGI